MLLKALHFNRQPRKSAKFTRIRKSGFTPAHVIPNQRLRKENKTALKKVKGNQNSRPDMPMVYEALDEFGVYSVYYRKDVRRHSDDYIIYVDRPQ